MSEFLLLTLYAPLASWGEIAVGEMRGSWDRPSRSAVFGLLAAALGITRADQPAQDALDRGYGMAVRLDAAGTPSTDYQTAQSVAASILKKRRPATRKAMLEAGEHETILSWRGYRADAMATVAIWAHGEPRWTLAELAAALRQPKFVLYAGRKANPFALPLNPAVIDADSLAAAFAARPAAAAGEILGWKPKAGWGRQIACDVSDDIVKGLTVSRREIRRDAAPQRTRWQFANRTVEISDG
jgi:CRISPR system Cascade subunit CasD